MQINMKCNTCGRGTCYAFFQQIFCTSFVKLQKYIAYCSVGVFFIAEPPRNAVHYEM